MQFKDYYAILGTKPDATHDQLRAAYRRLIRKYHPDVSKETNAEEKTKEVNEAWEALKDPERRKAYDQLRAGGYRGGDQFRPPPGWQSQQHGFDGFEGGEADFSDFFESLFRRGAAGQAQRPSGPRRGRDLRAHVRVPLHVAYAGGHERITLQDAATGERTLEVRIPAGILPGQQIRLAGQGTPGIQGGPAGDLLLEIDVAHAGGFSLHGRNVHSTLEISPWQAGLGGSVSTQTLGGEVELNIPAGTRSGRKLRLRGRGFPGSPAGDHIVTIGIAAPKAETDAQREAYEQLKRVFAG